MRLRASLVENKKSVESFLLVCVIVAASLAIMLPLSAPKVTAITHLGSTSAEDGGPEDMTGPGDFIVEWDGADSHIMNIPYLVESGYELIIPALDYLVFPPETIEIQGPVNITVQPGAKLTFETDGPFSAPTQFNALIPWEGIYFEPGSEARIQDVEINGAITALKFSPDSNILGPGIEMTTIQGFSQYGIYMDGAVGGTNLEQTQIYDTLNAGTGVFVSNGMLNLSGGTIQGHGNGNANLHTRNAIVSSDSTWFDGNDQPGNCVLVDLSPAPNSTVLDYPIFSNGAPDNYYVRGHGGSPLIINGTFDEDNNAKAAEAATTFTGVDSHITLLNPGDGSPFNSTRVNASFGDSTVAINWYVDVYVDDPDGNAIPNSLVDLEAPSWPDTKLTAAAPPAEEGWARDFVVTEKVVRYSTIDYFNPLNASAENNTMLGYAEPEPTIDTNTDVFITVPFNPIPNTLPTVSIDTVMSGIYTGLISFDFTVTDPDPGDDGFLEVLVRYWDPGMGLVVAEADVSSDLTTGLSSGTYTFVWDSRHINNLPDVYASNVWIDLTPSDKLGTGTPVVSTTFDVDNIGPVVLTGPIATPSDTSCIIEWTLDEAATSEVWYGLYSDGSVNDLTTEVVTLTLNTTPVLSLSSLLSGRRYTYVINSTDNMGNKYSSAPEFFFFETTLSIQLYTGWNMISIPHELMEWPLHLVLATIAGDWDIAMSYDANDPNNDPWKTNYTGKPYHMNDLHDYFTHMALWLHVTTDTVLTPNYMYDEFIIGTIDIPLVEGWNFVGYYSVAQRNIDDALSSIAGSYDMVEHYDASTDLWLRYDGSSGPLSTMEPTKGYWIHCTQAVLWVMPYE